MKFDGRKWMKRLTGLLLAVALVVSYGLYRSSDRRLRATSGAEEEMTEQAPEEKLTEETEKLVIPKEAKIPETKAPETKAPETKAPETEVPERETPETEPPQKAMSAEEEPEGKSEAKEEPEAPEERESGAAPEIPAESEEVEEVKPDQSEEAETAVEPAKDGKDSGKAKEEKKGEANASEGAETGAERTEEPEPKEPEETEPKEPEVFLLEEESEASALVLRAEAADGAMITVTAPEGALPAGAEVTVTLVTGEEAKEAVGSVLEDDSEVVEMTAYDISILDENGQEIQPALPVEIRIRAAGLGEDETVTVYRVDADGNAEELADDSDPQRAGKEKT